MLTRLIREETQVHEIRDRTRFRRIMDARRGQRVEVVVQVAPALAQGERTLRWWDFVQFWEGPWSEDLPLPTEPALQALGAQAGAAHARAVIRGVI